jgi:hypothetical protein
MIFKNRNWLLMIILFLFVAAANVFGQNSLPAPSNLTATANGNDVILNYAAASGAMQKTEELIVDKPGVNENAYGLGANGKTQHFLWVNKLTPSSYPATLTTAEIGWSTLVGEKEGQPFTLLVYKDPDNGGPNNTQTPDLKMTINVKLAGNQSNIAAYDISSANLTITQGSFDIGVLDDQTGLNYPATIDGSLNLPVGGDSFISLDEGATFTSVANGYPMGVMAMMGVVGSGKGSWIIRAKALEGKAGPMLMGYNIYRSTSSPVGITKDNLIGTVDANTLTFTDQNVPGENGSTVFYYVVTAVYSAGESLPSNEAMAVPEHIMSSGDFTLSIAPATQTLTPGTSTSLTLSVNAVGAFTDPIALSVTLAPTDINVSSILSADMITAGGNATLTVVAAAAAMSNSFTIIITGTSGTLTHVAMATVNVVAPDFSISASPVTVMRGESGTFTINISRTGGFMDTVTVSSPDTSALKIKIAPASMSVSASEISAVFNFKIKKKTPTGTQMLTFTGQDSSGRVRTCVLMLMVKMN